MGTSNPAVIGAVSSRKSLPAVKRQHRSPELKRQIVEETLAPGASVARVARAHGVNAKQVFLWRRQYRQGQLEGERSEAHGLRSSGRRDSGRAVCGGLLVFLSTLPEEIVT